MVMEKGCLWHDRRFKNNKLESKNIVKFVMGPMGLGLDRLRVQRLLMVYRKSSLLLNFIDLPWGVTISNRFATSWLPE